VGGVKAQSGKEGCGDTRSMGQGDHCEASEGDGRGNVEANSLSPMSLAATVGAEKATADAG
jgi:hypothetical protein